MSLRSRMPKSSFVPSVIAAGVLGTGVLALATTGTLSAFAASIENSVNTTKTASLVLQETNSDGSVTCSSSDSDTNAVTCATINKYGGQTLVPGGASTTTVHLTNLGTVTPKTFTLGAGECTQSGSAAFGTAATDLCAKLSLKVYAAATPTGDPVYDGTLAGFSTPVGLAELAPDESQAYTFVVSVPAGLDNTYQGLTASQPLTWTMSS